MCLYTGNFPLEAPFGTRGVGRMRKRDLSGPVGRLRHWCDVRGGLLPAPL